MKNHHLITLGLTLVLLLLSPHARASDFLAGAAEVELTVPDGISLAGFGGGKRRHLSPKEQNPFAHYLTASKGVHDPVSAKTLFLKFGAQNLVIIGLDLVATNRNFRKDLAKRLMIYGIEEKNILMTATHTHSGPGCASKSLFWQLLAADRFVPTVYEQFLNNITESVLMAMADLHPAQLGVQTFSAEGFTKNRRNNPEDLDPTGTLIKVINRDGAAIGTILNFPIHGTVMGTENLMVSADIPGALAKELARRTGGVVVFVNGAEGDVSPKISGRNFDILHLAGQRFADQVYPIWLSTKMTDLTRMNTVEKEIPLGPPKLNVMACAHKKSGSYFPNLPNKKMGLPKAAVLNILTLNNHAFISVPGEPISQVGIQLKALGTNAGFETTSIFGLANDHLAYILTEKEYLAGGYEACMSLYGKDLGKKITSGVDELFKELQF